MNSSLSDIANDTTLDDKHTCALQGGAVKRVTFDDDVDFGTTMAYSTAYGTLAKLVVATATGTMKSVSALADHYTGSKRRGDARAQKRMHPHLFTHISAEHLFCELSSRERVSVPAPPETEALPQAKAMSFWMTTLSTCLTISLAYLCLSIRP